jgi:hypothetical protein
LKIILLDWLKHTIYTMSHETIKQTITERRKQESVRDCALIHGRNRAAGAVGNFKVSIGDRAQRWFKRRKSESRKSNCKETIRNCQKSGKHKMEEKENLVYPPLILLSNYIFFY